MPKFKVPKPPHKVNSYLMFSKTMAEEWTDLGVVERGRKAGELWKEMGDDDKVPYEELAAEDYRGKMAAWEGGYSPHPCPTLRPRRMHFRPASSCAPGLITRE